MHAEKKNSECDARLLRGYLEQELTAEEEAAFEAHLDACASCRNRICDSAAEADWWTGASRYLKSDMWDEEVDRSPAGAPVTPKHNAERRGDEIVLRQLKQWLDPSDDPRFLGRFGGYEIVGVIGYGGMGVVLKGYEPSLNRYVAIKVLTPTLAMSGAARKRFAREAQAAAAVLHENVIAIHRVADAHGLPYLTMPYVGGMSLQKRIDEEGPLPLSAILRISLQIASGLAAAHAQGLVHRDIKPANILLERGVERVTITDFGLARAADDGSVTKSGFVAGTPQYMSPEQARGESLDARSDLFSLGSVMYAMCTGHPPFRAETSYGVLRRITDGQPRPIREVNADIPEWLETLVDRLHAKSPSERISSAEDLAELLEQCVAHVQQPTVSPLPPSLCPSGSPWRGRWNRIRHRPSVGMACVAVIGILSAVLVGPGLFHLPGNRSRISEPDRPPTASTHSIEIVPEGADAQKKSDQIMRWNDGIDSELQRIRDELSSLEERAGRLWDFEAPEVRFQSDDITSKTTTGPAGPVHRLETNP